MKAFKAFIILISALNSFVVMGDSTNDCIQALGDNTSTNTKNACAQVTSAFAVKCVRELGTKVSPAAIMECAHIESPPVAEVVAPIPLSSDECIKTLMSAPTCIDRLNATRTCNNPTDIKSIQSCMERLGSIDDSSKKSKEVIFICLGSFESSSKPESKETLCDDKDSKPLSINDSKMIKNNEADSSSANAGPAAALQR